jgi:uncharacterized protein
MKFFIIHGFGADSEANWFPWLKTELVKLGHEVVVPEFPNTDNPNLHQWLDHLKNYTIDKETVFIGHSLGAPFTLHFLENHALKAAYLVAGFCSLSDERFIPYISTFLGSFNWDKIKNNCDEFYVINSDNDDYVPVSKGQELAENLDVDLTLIKSKNHFMDFEFKDLLEMIKEKL